MMSDKSLNNPDAPTSEVGSDRANGEASGDGNNDMHWRLLLERQNQQMQALIQALRTPNVSNNVVLPEFNPEKRDANARSWCATADLCFADNPVEGSQLIVVISKALKGAASTWLAQITYPGMTWVQFKELFTARFVSVETTAATLINLRNDKPSENEAYGAYASRLITSILCRWREISTEQIAVSLVLAHLAELDTRLQRLAFTTEITTRHQLQQELQAFSYLKRRAPVDMKNVPDNAKRSKFSQSSTIKCYVCGKLGHKQAECRLKGKDVKKPLATPAPARTSQQASSSPVVCYKCGMPGHIASRCTAAGGGEPNAAPRAERRIDMCAVEPPSGT